MPPEQPQYIVSIITENREKLQIPPGGVDQLTATDKGIVIVHIGVTPEGGFVLSDSKGELGPPGKPGSSYSEYGFTIDSKRIEG
jgi:hypothetical protein